MGLIRWTWLEETLGLDRGFVDQVQTAVDNGTTQASGGDMGWRVPPAPDAPFNDRIVRGDAVNVPAIQPTAPPARVARVVQSTRSAQPAPSSAGCADSSAVDRLIARCPAWCNSDLALIACVRLQSRPTRCTRRWVRRPRSSRTASHGRNGGMAGVTVLVEKGRVISFGQ